MVDRIGDVCAALRARLAVADVVKVVAVAIRRVNRGGCIRQLTAGVVTIGIGVGRRERRAGLVAPDASTYRILQVRFIDVFVLHTILSLSPYAPLGC